MGGVCPLECAPQTQRSKFFCIKQIFFSGVVYVHRRAVLSDPLSSARPMRPLTLNPDNGFLESSHPAAFTGERKQLFIALAHQAVDEKRYPDVQSICKSVGISNRVFYQHLSTDKKLAEEWHEVKRRIASVFTTELAAKAMTKMGTLANIAMLRYLEAGRWNTEGRLNISTDSSHIKQVSSKLTDIIDAEVIDDESISK